MTTKLWLLLLLAIPVNIWAQDGSKLHLLLEARGDYQRDYVDKEAIKDDCGFKGKYLNVILTGDITPQVSYAYRQRLNKIHKNSSFFDATDWLYLNYQATQHLSFSGGKQVVGIGGYEYDRAPINLYFCSEFWNNIPCYQWGVSASYAITKNDKLTFQFCESPFRSFYEHADMYAYNLMWNGSHGIWNTIWSMNMLEWQEGKFINYISLGNEIRLAKNATLQLDYLNRAVSHQTFLFKDCSIVGEIAYQPTNKANIYVKASYDVNKSDNDADLMVHSGTELTRIGAGVEYYPLENKNLRIHANYSYAWGTNSNAAGTLQDKQSLIDLGLTWRMNIINKN